MNSPSPVERFITSIVGHPYRVLAAALLLTGLAGWGMSQIDIYTSRKAMLPDHLDVARRLNRFLAEFGAASDLIMVVEGAPRPDLEEFASQLARRLEREEIIRSATERVGLMFFLEHAYLMIPPDVLEKISDLPSPRPPPPGGEGGGGDWWEGWLEDPPELSSVDMDLKTAEEILHLVLFLCEQWQRWLTAPAAPESIDWRAVLARHGAESMASEYFTSRDGEMLFIFVRPAETSGEFDEVRPFIETVKRVRAELDEEWKSAGRQAPRVGLTGLPATTFEEYTAITNDILFTVTTAGVLILLLILLWLRSVRWALVVFVPMALGVVWNIGLAYLVVGHLTMITSGFTAILFGLGVDYGIFMSTRIIEERRREQDLKRAIARGAAASARALLTAGGATMLVFGALALVEFSGFAELGKVAGCGVGLVLLSTFVIQPVLFSLLPPRVEGGRARPAGTRPAPGVKISRPINVLLVLAAVSAAVAGGVAVRTIPFDYGVLSMLPEGSEAARYQRRMLEKSDYQGEVVIFTADSIDSARRMAERVSELPSVARVQGITDLFPSDAAERAELARKIGKQIAGSEYARRIRELGRIRLGHEADERIDKTVEKIRELVEDGQEQAFSAGHGHLVRVMERILETLEAIQDKRESEPKLARERTRLYVQTMVDAGKSALDVLAAWKTAGELTPADLPPAIRDRFFGLRCTVAFYAFPAGDIYDQQKLHTLMEQVYSVSDQATGFPTTHHLFSRLVVDSYRAGTLMAILAAMIWISLVLRRLRGIIIALLPLLVGGGWMMGIMAYCDMAFNFANILGLPLVIGLAVDYGVWFAHRKREFPDLDGWQVARLAGKAILLAAGTTLAGLGAITMASYRGIASMGVAITIGLLCCVTAALLISPAITQLLFRRKS